MLAHAYDIIIYHTIEAPGHRKAVDDVLSTIDKRRPYLLMETKLICYKGLLQSNGSSHFYKKKLSLSR